MAEHENKTRNTACAVIRRSCTTGVARGACVLEYEYCRVLSSPDPEGCKASRGVETLKSIVLSTCTRHESAAVTAMVVAQHKWPYCLNRWCVHT